MNPLISTIRIAFQKVTELTTSPQTIFSATPEIPFVFNAICECDDYFYIGTSHGLIEKNKKNGQLVFHTQKNSILPCNQINCLVCSQEGYLYIGTAKGLLLWNNKKSILITASNSSIPSNHITALAIDQEDNVWIGTKGGGMVKFVDIGKDPPCFQSVPTADKNIYTITVDAKGYVWVVFQGGAIDYYKNGISFACFPTSSFEEIEPAQSGKFVLHTNHEDVFLTDGTLFEAIHLDPTPGGITCSYYNSTYSRMMVCDESGIHVFSIWDPWSGHRNMTYSAFIHAICCSCSNKKINTILNQIRQMERAQMTS